MTPTADQLDLFRSLGPDQQQPFEPDHRWWQRGRRRARSSGARTGRQNRDTGTGEQNQFPSSTDQLEPLVPVLKPDDTLIIEIDFHLPPRTVPTVPLGQYAYVPGQQTGVGGAMPNAGIAPGGVGQTTPVPSATPAPTAVPEMTEDEKGATRP